MAFGGTGDSDIDITVTVDAEGATKALNNLGEEVAKVETKAEQGQAGFSKFQASIVALSSGINLASIALSAMAQAANTAIEFISRGSDVADVSEAFGKLAEKSGIVADTFLNQLNKATGETISNFDLMRKANEQLRAGLKPDEILTLSSAARIFADQDGKDFEEQLAAISDSLVRGNDKFLKTKGIVIDNNAAFKDFADQLGINVESLNEVGKAEAIRAAGMAKLSEMVKAHGEIENDAGDKIKSVSKIYNDAFNSIAKELSGNEGLLSLLDSLGNFLAVVIPKAVNLAVLGIKKVTDAFSAVSAKVTTTIDVLSEFYELGKKSSGFAEENKKVSDSYEDIRNNLKKADDGFNDFINKLSNDAVPTHTREVKKSADQYIDFTKKTEDQRDATTKLIDEARKYGVELANIDGKLQDITGMEFSGSLFGEGPGASDSIFGGMFSGISDQLSDALQNGVANAFSALASGDFSRGTVAGIGSDIGGALGAEFGPIGSAIGSTLGEAVGKGVYDSIDHVFGGGNDEGTKARKSADRFFADLFSAQRLGVIIDGQLKEIEDLTFGEGEFFSSGAFSEAFNSLSTEAKEGFAGVGAAFEELLGVTEDIGGQLAAVFTNNLGGSLNNLQLLVMQTGKSFEELEGAIVKSWENGTISALEAQSALQGIERIAQKGIPDAIGGVQIAWENLVASTESGGITSKDALQDLASEAKELGKKTLPELQQALLAQTGANKEAIEKLFGALSTYGVSSLEQLEDISSQTAIAILANLQANEFPFAEQVEKLDEIKKKLDEIPENIRRNLTFDVKVNASSDDRKLINQSQVTIPGGPGIS